MLTLETGIGIDGDVAVTLPDETVLTHGMQITLIHAPANSITLGSAASLILPDLDGDLMWDTSTVAENGTIRVASLFREWVEQTSLSGDDALPNADPDGDGLTNRMEFLLGFDPADRNSRLTLSWGGDSTSGVLRINRVIPEGTFTLETSPNLQGNWEIHTILSVEETRNDHAVPVILEEDRRFFRLRYHLPAP